MEAVLRKELEAAAASSNALRLTEERRKGPSTQPLGVVEVEWACNLMTTVREHRARLHQCQLELRAVEPLEKAQDDLPDDVRPIVLARDTARHDLINLLARALDEHDARAIPARLGELRAEAAELQASLNTASSQIGAALTDRLRLEKLVGRDLAPVADDLLGKESGDDQSTGASSPAPVPVLLALDQWEQETARMRAELDELLPHGGGIPPSVKNLQELHETWEDAMDSLTRAKSDKNMRKPPPDADEKVRAARHGLQQAERALRLERVRLANVAATHFPELFVREPLLRLGAETDGDALQGVLVEREDSHYTGPDGRPELVKLSEPNARHRVYRQASSPPQRHRLNSEPRPLHAGPSSTAKRASSSNTSSMGRSSGISCATRSGCSSSCGTRTSPSCRRSSCCRVERRRTSRWHTMPAAISRRSSRRRSPS